MCAEKRPGAVRIPPILATSRTRPIGERKTGSMVIFMSASQGKYLLLAWIARHIDQANQVEITLPPFELPETWLADLAITTQSAWRSPMGRVVDVAQIGGIHTIDRKPIALFLRFATGRARGHQVQLDAFLYQGGHNLRYMAAQPSHDWAAREPFTDFAVNAQGTLNLLEMTRQHCPEAVFIHTSTNKVYGDRPNSLTLLEQEKRWELDPSHAYAEHGIDEQMSVDQSQHSLFGASKLAADVLVQEYGRYFGLQTVCFRGGCLTGPGHAGAELHGFLAYLIINIRA